MRYFALFPVFLPSIVYSLPQAHKVGNICHAENAPFNYGGVWELSLNGNLICNYWQFLSDTERKYIESQLNEYGELTEQQIEDIQSDDEEYTDNYWEVDDWESSDWDTEAENEETETITEE
ncbi:Uncharacterised protein [Mannheimia haemolytica]|uniref:Uncharacterized protein n=1 Tax=Mannheimia haemolytica TaxID=75985 RepID=A0A378N8Y6_MANHA|nr:Uncharacterised protein [Mannheimia haemolytica]